MSRFEHIFWVCTHERASTSASGDCTRRGGPALLENLKHCIQAHGLKGRVRAVRSGCLDLCKQGCALAVFSRDAQGATEEKWYAQVKPEDAEALFEAHVLDRKPLNRLLWRSRQDDVLKTR